MKAIQTQLSEDGERMLAKDGDGNRISIPKPEQMSEWHREAAIALVRRMNWAPVVLASGWIRSGQWVHVMLPRLPENGQGRDLTYVAAEQEGV